LPWLAERLGLQPLLVDDPSAAVLDPENV